MMFLSLLACIRTPSDLPSAYPLPARLGEYDSWLADAEGRFDDIVPGAERSIRWNDPEKPEKNPTDLCGLVNVNFRTRSKRKEQCTNTGGCHFKEENGFCRPN